MRILIFIDMNKPIIALIFAMLYSGISMFFSIWSDFNSVNIRMLTLNIFWNLRLLDTPSWSLLCSVFKTRRLSAFIDTSGTPISYRRKTDQACTVHRKLVFCSTQRIIINRLQLIEIFIVEFYK